MKKQLSAKDKAFEKERAEFRKQIRELNHELNSVKFELHNMQRELDSKNNEIKNMQMVIDELKRCTKLSDDELKTLLEAREFDKKIYGYFSKIFKEGLI